MDKFRPWVERSGGSSYILEFLPSCQVYFKQAVVALHMREKKGDCEMFYAGLNFFFFCCRDFTNSVVSHKIKLETMQLISISFKEKAINK